MAQFGKVVTCNLKKDLETNRSRGFGFVVFASADCIEKVIYCFIKVAYVIHNQVCFKFIFEEHIALISFFGLGQFCSPPACLFISRF